MAYFKETVSRHHRKGEAFSNVTVKTQNGFQQSQIKFVEEFKGNPNCDVQEKQVTVECNLSGILTRIFKKRNKQ